MIGIEWLQSTIYEMEIDTQEINNSASLFCSYFGGDIEGRGIVASHLSSNSEAMNYVRSIESCVLDYRRDLLQALRAIDTLLGKHPEDMYEIRDMMPNWKLKREESK